MAFKVYTKTGDKGTTALIGGTRVGKDSIRIEAYGTVDELNSHIGIILSMTEDEAVTAQLREIQDRLFTVGSSLATDPNKDVKMRTPDLHESDVLYLEESIDKMEEQLPPLKHFVLPGGHVAASHAHVARCVCRRVERICVQMIHTEEYVAEVVLRYLNRLSDYLFVLSRYILIQAGGIEIEWKPRLS